MDLASIQCHFPQVVGHAFFIDYTGAFTFHGVSKNSIFLINIHT